MITTRAPDGSNKILDQILTVLVVSRIGFSYGLRHFVLSGSLMKGLCSYLVNLVNCIPCVLNQCGWFIFASDGISGIPGSDQIRCRKENQSWDS